MKFFLPVLFVCYMGGIHLFTHTHVVNGVIVVHSHLYDKGLQHEHTTVELNTIFYLTHFLVTDPVAFVCSALTPYWKLLFVVLLPLVPHLHYNRLRRPNSLRAPPVIA